MNRRSLLGVFGMAIVGLFGLSTPANGSPPTNRLDVPGHAPTLAMPCWCCRDTDPVTVSPPCGECGGTGSVLVRDCDIQDMGMFSAEGDWAVSRAVALYLANGPQSAAAINTLSGHVKNIARFHPEVYDTAVRERVVQTLVAHNAPREAAGIAFDRIDWVVFEVVVPAIAPCPTIEHMCGSLGVTPDAVGICPLPDLGVAIGGFEDGESLDITELSLTPVNPPFAALRRVAPSPQKRPPIA